MDACFRHGNTAAALLVSSSKVCMSSTVFEHFKWGEGGGDTVILLLQ